MLGRRCDLKCTRPRTHTGYATLKPTCRTMLSSLGSLCDIRASVTVNIKVTAMYRINCNLPWWVPFGLAPTFDVYTHSGGNSVFTVSEARCILSAKSPHFPYTRHTNWRRRALFGRKVRNDGRRSRISSDPTRLYTAAEGLLFTLAALRR